jgi:hypothetical protein
LSDLVHYPDNPGAKAKIKEVQLLGFYPRLAEADLRTHSFIAIRCELAINNSLRQQFLYAFSNNC